MAGGVNAIGVGTTRIIFFETEVVVVEMVATEFFIGPVDEAI
jgi:hypothetical protein